MYTQLMGQHSAFVFPDLVVAPPLKKKKKKKSNLVVLTVVLCRLMTGLHDDKKITLSQSQLYQLTQSYYNTSLSEFLQAHQQVVPVCTILNFCKDSMFAGMRSAVITDMDRTCYNSKDNKELPPINFRN